MATDSAMTPQHVPSAAQPVQPGPVFTRLDHIGIAVRDLEQAKRFYVQTFGMRVTHEEINEAQGVREAMLSIDGVGGPYIQLLAPLTPESTIAKFIDRNGEGVQQVAYGVDDVAATSALLSEKGIRSLYDQPRTGTGGSQINFLHPKDAGGVLVELVQSSAGHTSHEPHTSDDEAVL